MRGRALYLYSYNGVSSKVSWKGKGEDVLLLEL